MSVRGVISKLGPVQILFYAVFILFNIEDSSCHTFPSKSTYKTSSIIPDLAGFVDYNHVSPNLQDIVDILKNDQVLNNLKLADLNVFYSSLMNAYNNASRCSQDLMYIVNNINLQDLGNSWALKMLDSFGKPSSGILEGNLNWVGDFDECRSVYAPKQSGGEAGGFRGKYCSLQLKLAILPVTVGVCVPETCDSSDFGNDTLSFLNISQIIPSLANIDSMVEFVSISCKKNTRNLTTGAVVTMCVLSIFAILALIGSSITVFKYCSAAARSEHYTISSTKNMALGNGKENSFDRFNDDVMLVESSNTKMNVYKKKCENFFNCFCFFSNGSKLLSTDGTEGQLLCLHGIRFLSMSWVILCHTYMTTINLFGILHVNPSQVDNLPFQVILNGFISVDSFFVLSGFLMAYLYFQEAEKRSGNMPWLYFYIHRYLRLTPVYMIVLGFYATLLTYFGSGPFWPDNDIEPLCKTGWWWNLLYINNFQKTTEECMGWSWYLSNDMQFFAISPLFLITLWRWPKVGYFILSLCLCGTLAASFAITYYYNIIVGAFSDITTIATTMSTFLHKWYEYSDKIYNKPYTRIGPYLVGIGVAYILYKRKLTNSKIPRIALWIGWAIATAVALACVYGLYHNSPNRVAASFYNALSRTSYGASLSWVIFVCLSGQGGIVDRILSFKLFLPLSRLTYCAYLIHPIVMSMYFGALRIPPVFSHSTMVILFLGLILVTYAFSFLVSLLFESPVIRLEKFVRSQFKS